MDSSLISVFVADGIGITLMIMASVTNRELYLKGTRFKYLILMVLSTLATCLSDMISFAIERLPGTLNTVLLYIFNSWLFLAVLLITHFWTKLLCDCMGVRLSRFVRIAIWVIDAIGVIMLIVNAFFPFIFRINTPDNTYERLEGCWIYVAIGVITIAYGLLRYFEAKKKGGIIIYFSVSAFVLPMLIGITIQLIFYGVSLIWVSVAISMIGIISSIKNEVIFIDQLTGVYNRYYLEKIKSNVSKRSNVALTGIMADLNKFKHINDTFGHKTGDEALVKTASILTKAVGTCGRVIRYAGDEFVIVIDSTDKLTVLGIIDRINQGCEEFNSHNYAPYKLSLAMGYDTFNVEEQSVDEFMNAIDAKMYENKQEYHRTHPDN